MDNVIQFIQTIWKPCIEIAIFWWGYYVLLKFLRSTGAIQVLKGLLWIFVFFVLVQFTGLETIAKLIREIIPISVIAFLILFQSELRRGLTRIGQSPIFKLFIKEEHLIDEMVKAMTALSKKKIGALIAIEKEVSLKQFEESGVTIDRLVSFELISTIFMPTTPLHDGGVVIRGSRIDSAGCLFPLSQSPRISKTIGTRHRAALGLSEESDALVFVVSEETGIISIAEKGQFQRDVDAERIKKRLKSLYFPPNRTKRQRSWMSFLSPGEKKSATSR